MTPTRERVLKFIQKNPGVTYKELSKFTGKSRQTNYDTIHILVNLGVIHEIIPPRETRIYPGKKK